MRNHKFVVVYLEKKFLFGFRLLMLFVAYVFAMNAYEAIDTSVIRYRGREITSELGAFYLHLLKEVLISLLFLWLATGGAKEKKNKE